MGGVVYKPLKRHNWWPGNLGASALVVGAWAALIYTGSVSTIWPMFGVANQLLATLAFAIGTTVIIKMGKTRYAAITVFPMLFMAVMTLTASYHLVVRFWRLASEVPAEAFTYRLDMVLVMIMAGLGAIIIADSAVKWWQLLTGRRSLTSTELSFEEVAA